MDTSEIYIKMCEKAEEIQELAPKKFDKDATKGGLSPVINHCADFVQVQRDRSTVSPAISKHKVFDSYWGSSTNDRSVYRYSTFNIWLPRQDQLQEMIDEANGIFNLMWLFKDYLFGSHESVNDSVIKFTSLEQLWLAFVMKEKYGKIWDGTDWVTTKQ